MKRIKEMGAQKKRVVIAIIFVTFIGVIGGITIYCSSSLISQTKSAASIQYTPGIYVNPATTNTKFKNQNLQNQIGQASTSVYDNEGQENPIEQRVSSNNDIRTSHQAPKHINVVKKQYVPEVKPVQKPIREPVVKKIIKPIAEPLVKPVIKKEKSKAVADVKKENNTNNTTTNNVTTPDTKKINADNKKEADIEKNKENSTPSNNQNVDINKNEVKNSNHNTGDLNKVANTENHDKDLEHKSNNQVVNTYGAKANQNKIAGETKVGNGDLKTTLDQNPEKSQEETKK